MRISAVWGGLAVLGISVVGLPAIFDLNRFSTIALSPVSYTLIGIAVAIAVAGVIQWVRRDSHPQTGFSLMSNMRRDQPKVFFRRCLILVAATAAVTALGAWYTLKVVTPHLPGRSAQFSGIIESMQKVSGRGRSCNVLSSIRLQTHGLVVICYDWGLVVDGRISEDELFPGNNVTASIVTNWLGTAVTSVALREP